MNDNNYIIPTREEIAEKEKEVMDEITSTIKKTILAHPYSNYWVIWFDNSQENRAALEKIVPQIESEGYETALDLREVWSTSGHELIIFKKGQKAIYDANMKKGTIAYTCFGVICAIALIVAYFLYK